MLNKETYNLNLIKGFLCVCVVIGHCQKTVPNGIIQIIYWFHMPCFFMISGWFLKPPENILSWLKNKVIRIWVPQIIWFFLLFLISGKLSIKNILYFICGARNLGGVWWYVPTLFFSMLIFIIIERFFLKHWVLIFLLISYLFSCVDYYFIIPIINKNGLSFSIGVAMLSLIYVSLGYFLRKYLVKRGEVISKNVVILSTICIITFVVLYKMGIYKYNMNMVDIKLGSVLLNLVIPLSVMIFLLYSSTKIKRFCRIGAMIEKYGRNSLMIMYLHKYILNEILEPIFGIEGYIWIINVLLTLTFTYLVCLLVSKNPFLCKCLGGEIFHEK